MKSILLRSIVLFLAQFQFNTAMSINHEDASFVQVRGDMDSFLPLDGLETARLEDLSEKISKMYSKDTFKLTGPVFRNYQVTIDHAKSELSKLLEDKPEDERVFDEKVLDIMAPVEALFSSMRSTALENMNNDELEKEEFRKRMSREYQSKKQSQQPAKVEVPETKRKGKGGKGVSKQDFQNDCFRCLEDDTDYCSSGRTTPKPYNERVAEACDQFENDFGNFDAVLADEAERARKVNENKSKEHHQKQNKRKSKPKSGKPEESEQQLVIDEPKQIKDEQEQGEAQEVSNLEKEPVAQQDDVIIQPNSTEQSDCVKQKIVDDLEKRFLEVARKSTKLPPCTEAECKLVARAFLDKHPEAHVSQDQHAEHHVTNETALRFLHRYFETKLNDKAILGRHLYVHHGADSDTDYTDSSRPQSVESPLSRPSSVGSHPSPLLPPSPGLMSADVFDGVSGPFSIGSTGHQKSSKAKVGRARSSKQSVHRPVEGFFARAKVENQTSCAKPVAFKFPYEPSQFSLDDTTDCHKKVPEFQSSVVIESMQDENKLKTHLMIASLPSDADYTLVWQVLEAAGAVAA